MSHLNDEGEHGLSVSGVFGLSIFSIEFLLVVLVLLQSPDQHLSSGNNKEEISGIASSQSSESEPSIRFPQVVSARNQAKAPSVGDSSLGMSTLFSAGRCRSEFSESDVAHQIQEFEKDKESSKTVLDFSGISGVFPEEEQFSGDQNTTEDPVVERVFKDILKGHGTVTEDVDKQGFDFSFGVMEDNKPEGQSLVSDKFSFQ